MPIPPLAAGALVALALVVVPCAMMVLLARMVLRHSESGPDRAEWLLRVGVSVLVPLSKVDQQRLEQERRLAETQLEMLREMRAINREDRAAALAELPASRPRLLR